MNDQNPNKLFQHVRTLVAATTFRALPDRELLDRFVDLHDDAAFAALMERHGAMVFAVCKRVLGNCHDGEDACQAAFLVLVRKASSIRKKDSIGSWLHGVAYRVASDLKKQLARNKAGAKLSGDVPVSDTVSDVTWREIQAALDEELRRLPERHRAPLVLCYLEGKTRDEAAQQLGWSLGSLRGRLDRGRELLRARMVRRGITLSAALFAAALAEKAPAAALPTTLALSTVKAAVLIVSGQTITGTAIPAKVASLTEGVLKTMFFTKSKLMFVALLAVLLGGFGASTILQLARAQEQTRESHPSIRLESEPIWKNAPSAKAGPADRGNQKARHRFTVNLTKTEPWPNATRCAFLDNNRILVQPGTSTGLEIRGAKTGNLLKRVGIDGHFIGDFRLSANRKWVAAVTTADTTGTFVIPRSDVTIWDTTSWTVRGTIHGRTLLDVASDGRTVLVGNNDGLVRRGGRVEVWDLAAKKMLKASPFMFHRFDAAAFSPDSSLVAVSGRNEIVYWKWRVGETYDRLKVGRKVDALVFSSDGKLVAEGPDSRMTVEIRNVATLKVTTALTDAAQPRIPQMVAGMTFAHSDRTLVFGNKVGLIETIPVPHRIHFWDVRSGKLTLQIDLKGGAPYWLDVSPDGKVLAATAADGGVSLRVFDLESTD